MQVIDDGAALERALASPIEPAMCRLITERLDQLLADTGGEYGWPELVRFLLVNPTDTAETIETAAGCPVISSPCWEWVIDHGGILEGAVILSDDGFGLVVLVAITEGVCPDLLTSMQRHTQTVSEHVTSRTYHERSATP